MPSSLKKKAGYKEQNSIKARLAGKPVSASRSEIVEAVLPNDANPLGKMLGGRVGFGFRGAAALARGRGGFQLLYLG